MGKVEEALRSEVIRLVRRELRNVVVPLGRQVRELRRRMGPVTRAVARLERLAAVQEREIRARRERLEVSEEDATRARLSAGLIRKLRLRLGVSQSQLAALVGVSTTAVTQWERGAITPRGQNRAALVALRRVGRRDVRRMLEQKGLAAPRRGARIRRSSG
jgi:putative transcriptional regulator